MVAFSGNFGTGQWTGEKWCGCSFDTACNCEWTDSVNNVTYSCRLNTQWEAWLKSDRCEAARQQRAGWPPVQNHFLRPLRLSFRPVETIALGYQMRKQR